MLNHLSVLYSQIISCFQANSKAQDAKKMAKGKALSTASLLGRPQLARPSTKVAPVELPTKSTAIAEQSVVDSEATLYYSPENKPMKPKLPANVEDFDSECGTDPFQTPQYAHDIFLYFKQREVCLSSNSF